MTVENPTKPIDVEGSTAAAQVPWQRDDIAWSFGSQRTRLLSALNQDSTRRNDPAANRNGMPTSGVQRITVPDRRPKSPPPPSFGKRGFEPLYQWEGVVEEMNDSGFRARLVPSHGRRPAAATPEFTEFDFDDLADPSDLDLVEVGAVFYWTLGRARNEAGTITNTSLVRFRRLPSPSPYQHRRAQKEASELLAAFESD